MKTQSKTLVGKMLAVAALGLGTMVTLHHPVEAASGSSGQRHEMAGRRRGHRDPAAMLQHMTQELSLTARQQAKIKPILEKASTRRRAVFANTSLSREQKQAAMRRIGDDMHRQMDAILTSTQKAKLRQMKQNHRDHPGQGGPDR